MEDLPCCNVKILLSNRHRQNGKRHKQLNYRLAEEVNKPHCAIVGYITLLFDITHKQIGARRGSAFMTSIRNMIYFSLFVNYEM